MRGGSSLTNASCPSRQLPASFTCGWAPFSSTLSCVARWWAERENFALGEDGQEVRRESLRLVPDDGVHVGCMNEAIHLVHAVAGAYASAVEWSGETLAAARVIGTPGVLRDRALRAADRASQGRDGLNIPRERERTPGTERSPYEHIVAPAQAPATQIPHRFAAAISALMSVPHVQPELMRALKAVLERFARAPLDILRHSSGPCASTALERRGQGDGKSRDETGQAEGEMAPPPRRQPSGQKRRVSLDAGGLRAAAAGRDGDEDQTAVLRSPELGARNPFDDESMVPPDGVSRSTMLSSAGSPVAFSSDFAMHEAVHVVLNNAKAAIDYFGVGGSAVDVAVDIDVSAKGSSRMTRDRDGIHLHVRDSATSTIPLQMLVHHTASITSALRMLAPFVYDARCQPVPRDVDDDERGRGLDARVASTRQESKRLPEIMNQLTDAFTAAVHAGARYNADGVSDDDLGNGVGSASVGNRVHGVGNSTADAPRSVAWLWDMLVDCASELPMHLLSFRSSPDEDDDAADSRSRLATTVGYVAQKSLELILTPGSAVLNAAVIFAQDIDMRRPSSLLSSTSIGPGVDNQLRDVNTTVRSLWTPGLVHEHGKDSVGRHRRTQSIADTFLGPASISAPFPLKCFLLASAFANGEGQNGDDLEDGGIPELSHGQQHELPRLRNGRRGEDTTDDSPSKKRARTGKRSNGDATNADGGKDSGDRRASLDGDGSALSVDEAFLAGLRHVSSIVTQCAVASLPTLPICTTKEGGCSKGSNGDHGGSYRARHVDSCTWRTRWLPALLGLFDSGTDCSETIRLELAAALPRLGLSLAEGDRISEDNADPGRLHPPKHATPAGVYRDRRAPKIVAGPNAFADLLPLWPPLLKDESAVVRAASARAAMAAAAAAPLSLLKATDAPGARVLRLLIDMLACGDPEVAWVVAGGAGQFVADDGKILRALYATGNEEGRDEEDEDDEADEEETLGAEEVVEREGRLKEKALSKFIETAGKMLQEHGDRLRLGRWQSLHDFTALLRALG